MTVFYNASPLILLTLLATPPALEVLLDPDKPHFHRIPSHFTVKNFDFKHQISHVPRLKEEYWIQSYH